MHGPGGAQRAQKPLAPHGAVFGRTAQSGKPGTRGGKGYDELGGAEGGKPAQVSEEAQIPQERRRGTWASS